MCECVFCHRKQIITDFVYEDELVMAFMDMAPINERHVLLVPKQHYLDADDGFGWTYGSEEKAVTVDIAKRIKIELSNC